MQRYHGTIAEQLAQYVYHLGSRLLPDEFVVHEVKRRVIDTFACALGAFDAEPVYELRRVRKNLRNKNGATIWGTNIKVPIEYAAEVNCFASRYLDWNDTYFGQTPGLEPAHPSDNIAAIVALCEKEKLDGPSLIWATILAYEIQCRLCDAAGLRNNGWDHVNHIIPATAASLAMLKGYYSPDRITQVIANALMQGFQPRINRDSDQLSSWKGFAAAEATFKGVRALELAQALEAPVDIYEGKSGFQDTVLRGTSIRIHPFWFGGQGGDFQILDTSLKLFNAEFHAQLPVELILRARPSLLGRLDQIQEIEFLVAEPTFKIIGLESKKQPPKNKETADHSLHYMASVALLDGELTEKQYVPEKLADEKVHRLMNKVKVTEYPKYTQCYPEKLSTTLRITLSDGSVLKKRSDYPVGHPQKPMTDSQVEEKFMRLSRKAISQEQAEAFLDAVWNLEHLDDVGKLVRP